MSERSCSMPNRPPAPAWPPRAPRFSVLLGATIEHFGQGATTYHRVRDLSPGGLRVDGGQQLKRGATVLITVGTLESVGATVVWTADGWAGLKFAKTIDVEHARAKVVVQPRSRMSRPAA